MWVSTQREYREKVMFTNKLALHFCIYCCEMKRGGAWKVSAFRVAICWVHVLSGRECLDCRCEVIV